MFDRLLNTGVEELRLWSGVKEAVEIARIVENADVEFFRRLPLDQRQQSRRIAFQSDTVFIELLQDRRGDRKTPGGVNFRWASTWQRAAAARDRCFGQPLFLKSDHRA